MAFGRKKDKDKGKSKGEVAVKREEHPLAALRRDMDGLLQRFFGDFDLPKWPEFPFSPKIDVSETNSAVKVTAELPGIEEKQLDVSLAGDTVTIRGEKKEEKETKEKQFYRMERSYGSFQRTIALPAEIDPDKAKAAFKKGVLTLELPKSGKPRKERKVPITAG